MNHNAIGRGYETFGNGTAETLMQDARAPDDDPREWYRVPPPPARPFRWSARDNVNYNADRRRSPALDLRGAASEGRCCAISIARATTPGARASIRRRTRS